MQKNTKIYKLSLLLLAIAIMFGIGIDDAQAATLNVGPGQTYNTINAAITAANPQDTIIVHDNNGNPYTYTENVVVNKNLTINSSGNVIINASGVGNAIQINSGGTGSTIKGFNLTGATGQSTAGIRLNSASYVKILQNNIYGNWAGIFMWPDARYNQIYENNISNNNRHGIRITDRSGYNNIYSNIINNNNLDNQADSGNTRYGGITYSQAAIGNDNIYFNQIVGNLRNQLYDPDNTINAINNWWGSNSEPTGVTGATYTPWLVLGITANPYSIDNGQTSTITADLTHNYNGVTYTDVSSLGHVKDGIPITFIFTGPPLGTLSINPVTTLNGIATTIFTANTAGTSHINATLNSANVHTASNPAQTPCDIIINPVARLTVDKYPDRDPAYYNVGEDVVYTITVRNTGPDAATGVVVTDTLPAGLTIINPAGGTVVGNVITWNVGNQNLNDVFTALVTARVNAGTQGQTLTNTVSAINTQNPTPITDTSDIYVNNAVLTVDKYPDRDPAYYNVGEDVVYTVTLRNTGPDTATGVVLTDTIPAGLSFVIATNGGTESGGVVTWNVGNLGLNEAFTALVTALVNAGTQGQSPTNTASAYNLQNPTPVTATSDIHVNTAPMTITKTAGQSSYNVGETVTYTIDVSNGVEVDTATGVVVTDTLPAGLTFLSASDGGVWDANTRTVTWTVGDLAVGASFTPTVTATVTGDAAAKTLVNTATARNDQMDDPVSAEASIYVPSADLILTKTVDKTKPTVKDTVVFTLIVNNHGPDTAVDVTVFDKLPAGVTYVSHVANYGTYDPATGLWSISSLPNGASAVLTITAVVEESGRIVNQANVTALTWDPNLEGNTASAAMDVQKKVEPVPVNGKTVKMQKTGAPIVGLLLAFFMLLAGMVLPRRK